MLGWFFGVLGAFGAWFAVGGTPHSWWSGPEVTLLGSPSRDGKLLSFADPATGALGIRNLADGRVRTIAARPAGSREFAYFSVFSRDGSRVAYAWSNEAGFYELRVVSARGDAAPKTLYRNEAAGFVQPTAWTPDDRYVLTLLFRRDNISQIVLIPAAGGAPRVLRSLNWVYPKRMDLSPDGHWIAYDNFAVEGKPERTIFLLSVDGSAERRLIESPGNYLFPMWSATGQRVVCAGDRGGAQDLWAVNVAGGETKGPPQRVSEDLGRILPLGMTDSDEVFYGVRTGLEDISIGGVPIHTRFPGRNRAPAWSHDGKRLAYLSRRGTENFGQEARVIVVMDLETGAERELPARMAHIERVAWSPDGSALLAAGSDGKGRSGLFVVRVEDGSTLPLAAEHEGPFRGFEAAWSSDGRVVYYLRGPGELRTHRIADHQESVLLRAQGMQHLAVNPAGGTLAVGIGGNALRLTPLQDGVTPRLIPFTGLSDLAWGAELYAGRGSEVWSVPLAGGTPRRIAAPADRLPGIAVAPDGHTLALAGGHERVEVRSFALSR